MVFSSIKWVDKNILMKLVQSLWKHYGVSSKVKNKIPYDPAIALLGVYPKNIKILIQRDTCNLMFTAAFSTIPNYGNNSNVH